MQERYAEALERYAYARGPDVDVDRAIALRALGRSSEAFAPALRSARVKHDRRDEALDLALELRPTDERSLWLECERRIRAGDDDPIRLAAVRRALEAYLKHHPQGKQAKSARWQLQKRSRRDVP